jgi:CRISPR/Cas system CMR subunit Cmr4 (Cas7 group RAMP superfamily)
MEELTIKAAAEYYGKSEYWIRKRILSGELEAEKRPFQYGQRWITTEKALDQLAADLKEQAKIEKDSINIREVSKPVDKKEFINELIEATESRNKALVDEAVNNINKKFEQQNELIMELKQEIEQQRKENNKSLVDKIKNLFK